MLLWSGLLVSPPADTAPGRPLTDDELIELHARWGQRLQRWPRVWA